MWPKGTRHQIQTEQIGVVARRHGPDEFAGDAAVVMGDMRGLALGCEDNSWAFSDPRLHCAPGHPGLTSDFSMGETGSEEEHDVLDVRRGPGHTRQPSECSFVAPALTLRAARKGGAPRKIPFIRPESRFLGCPLGTPRPTVGTAPPAVKGLFW